MNKNEYRRAFIMLRPAQPGWAGHVRLERRTMTGSMYFIVTPGARDVPARAAVVGRRGNEYYAASLGALRSDGRGQLTLASTFDPRNIDGRPLEAYQLLVVASVGRDCAVALTGNVDSAYPMDDARVREAVCALFRPDAPAADLPAPGEAMPGDGAIGENTANAAAGPDAGASPGSQAASEESPGEPAPDPAARLIRVMPPSAAPDSASIAGDLPTPNPVQEPNPSAPFGANAASPDAPAGEAYPGSGTENAGASPVAPPATGSAAPASDPPILGFIVETPESGASAQEPVESTPGLNPPAQGAVASMPDPGTSTPANGTSARDSGAPAATAEPEQVQEAPDSAATRIYTRMRAAQPRPQAATASTGTPAEGGPAVENAPEAQSTRVPLVWRVSDSRSLPGPCTMPLEDGYAYTRAPLPTACGGWCLVGVRLSGDRVAAIRLALPGDYAARPPEGIDDAVWVGAGSRGYWVVTVRCGQGDGEG